MNAEGGAEEWRARSAGNPEEETEVSPHQDVLSSSAVSALGSAPPPPALSPALTGSRAGGSAHGIAETADRERKRWRRLWTEEDSGGPPTRQRGPRLPGSQTVAARCP